MSLYNLYFISMPIGFLLLCFMYSFSKYRSSDGYITLGIISLAPGFNVVLPIVVVLMIGIGAALERLGK